MLLVALFIAVVLIVAAIRNSQGALFAALKVDVPGYVVWAAALLAVGAVGYIPKLAPIAKGLVALILLVIILRNYQSIITGFQTAIVGAQKVPTDATKAPGYAVASALANTIDGATQLAGAE